MRQAAGFRSSALLSIGHGEYFDLWHGSCSTAVVMVDNLPGGWGRGVRKMASAARDRLEALGIGRLQAQALAGAERGLVECNGGPYSARESQMVAEGGSRVQGGGPLGQFGHQCTSPLSPASSPNPTPLGPGLRWPSRLHPPLAPVGPRFENVIPCARKTNQFAYNPVFIRISATLAPEPRGNGERNHGSTRPSRSSILACMRLIPEAESMSRVVCSFILVQCE